MMRQNLKTSCMKPNYRRCIICREIAPKEAFWRIVRVYPTRAVQLDKGMGRSAYLCPSAACLKAAQRKNRLGRSLRVAVSDDVYEQLWQRLKSSSADISEQEASTGC